MKTCGFENLINLYLDGELSGEKLRSFEAHLEDCPACREEVEQYRGLLNSLHGLEERDVPPMLEARLHAALAKETEKGDGRVKRKVNPWALSAIAAAVVLLVGGYALFNGVGAGIMHSPAALQNDLMGGVPEAMPAATAAAQAAPTEAPQVNTDKGRGLVAPEGTMAAGALGDKATESLAGPSFSAAKTADNGTAGNGSNPPQQTDGRKIIYTAYLVVETRDYSKCMGTVEGLITKYNGYKQNSQLSGVPDSADSTAGRTAVISLRLPIDKYDAAMKELQAMGNVLSNNESTEDVSRQYVDTEARNKTLKDERARLEDLLAKADSMDSIIALQNQITELTTEIEQATAQLNFWNDQVAYSTITVEIHELATPKEIKPADPDLNTRVNGAFYNTLNNMKKGFENFEVSLVGFLPWLLIIVVLAGVAIAVIVPVSRKARRIARQKAEAEAEARAEAETGSAKKEE